MGRVTQVGSNTFRITDSNTGNQLTFTTSGTTTYNNFTTNGTNCTTANTFNCIANNQIAMVNFGVSGTTPSQLNASNVTLSNGYTNQIQGTVVATNGTSFTILTTGSSPTQAGVTNGGELVVTPSMTATYSVNPEGLTVPGGLNFTGLNNVTVGQNISLNATSVTGSNVAADQVMLTPSQFSANLSGVSGSNLTLNQLNGLYASSGYNTLTVNTQTGTTYTGVTGISGLTTGNTVTVGGLVYNTGTGYTVVGGQVGETTTP
jgi:hypothetical protein